MDQLDLVRLTEALRIGAELGVEPGTRRLAERRRPGHFPVALRPLVADVPRRRAGVLVVDAVRPVRAYVDVGDGPQAVLTVLDVAGRAGPVRISGAPPPAVATRLDRASAG